MKEVSNLKERLREQRPASWETLTDIPLYMDQVLSLMSRQTIRFGEEDALTAAMVNNYIKDGVVPRAEGKRYHAEHLAYLTMVCVLKQVLAVKDAALLTGSAMETRSVQENYDRFCAELSSALNSAADQLPEEMEEGELGENAMKFALLSYAIGLTSRRVTENMREREMEEHGEKKQERRKRKRTDKTGEGEQA